MQISAKSDYAVRALAELAAAGGGPVKGDRLAAAQQIPPKFLEAILAQLRHAGLVQSRRGAEGGYWLARPPEPRSRLADIIRAVDGPLASVRGQRPETVTYDGPARRLTEVWVALRASLRLVARGGHPRRCGGRGSPACGPGPGGRPGGRDHPLSFRRQPACRRR